MGSSNVAASGAPGNNHPLKMSALEQEENYPKSLQEELDEMLEAFYELVGEDDMVQFQRYVETVRDMRLADGAIKEGEVAPDFELTDQDGERVRLYDLLENGPVVMTFYRGTWCPHCHATLMALQRHLDDIKAAGGQLVAISPMNPDGTAAMASKRFLEFPVLSDVGNAVARKFKITFEVPEKFHTHYLKLGEDIPKFNADGSWEIPLPATFIIDTDRKIHWSFVDDDQTLRAEPSTIVDAIPRTNGGGTTTGTERGNGNNDNNGKNSGRRQRATSASTKRKSLIHRFLRSIKKIRRSSRRSSGGGGASGGGSSTDELMMITPGSSIHSRGVNGGGGSTMSGVGIVGGGSTMSGVGGVGGVGDSSGFALQESAPAPAAKEQRGVAACARHRRSGKRDKFGPDGKSPMEFMSAYMMTM